MNWQNVFFLMVIIYSYYVGYKNFDYSNKKLIIKIEWKDILVFSLLLAKFPKGVVLSFIILPLIFGIWFSYLIQNS